MQGLHFLRQWTFLRATGVAVLSTLLSGLTFPYGPGKEEPTWEQLVLEAKQARAARDAARALALFQKAVQRNPSWAEGWLNVGVLLADQNDCGGALEALKKATELDSQKGDGWILTGVCEFRLGRYDDALVHLEKARGMSLMHKALAQGMYYHSALILIRRGDFDSARQRLVLLSREGGEGVKLQEAMGLAALRRPVMPDEAPQDLRAVARELGALLMTSDRRPVDEVYGKIQALVRKDQPLPGLSCALGVYLASHGRYHEAYAAFEDELAISPNDATTLAQMAALLLNPLNQPDKARALAEKAVQKAPGEFSTRFIFGKALLRQGNLEGAIRELETAAKLAPQSSAVHYALLLAYRKAQRKEDAARQEAVLKRLHAFEVSLQAGAEKPEASRTPE